MAATQRSTSRDGLSLQTLIIAAVASAVAAIVTSTFWRGGTIITAAMTPVIVSIMKELLARPMESDLVRRPVERVRAASPPAGVATRRFERPRDARIPAEARAGRGGPPPARRTGAPPALHDEALARDTAGDAALGTAAPVRTYGRRRRLRIGAAVVTGVVAFVVAVVVLTVPELLFGGSVASHGTTTLFGGHSQKSTTTPSHTSTGGSSTSTTTTPQQSSPSGPSTSTSQTPTSQQTPPSQQQPNQSQSPTPRSQSPAPSSPAPQSGGTPPAK